MSEYPDPDEEYELMYADELEMLQEIDDRGNIVYTAFIRYKTLNTKLTQPIFRP